MWQQDIPVTLDLAGSLLLMPETAGSSLAGSTQLPALGLRRLLLSPILGHGQVHVYHAHCRAGERVRVQLHTPALPTGRGLAPAFAIVARSLPYTTDSARIPIDIPKGYSAVIASAPDQLLSPLRDAMTGVDYYPGPVIDTRMLVSGTCYLVVWSPRHLMGAYMLSIGYKRTQSWLYWLGFPVIWWRLLGWYRQSSAAGYLLVIGLILIIWLVLKRRKRNP